MNKPALCHFSFDLRHAAALSLLAAGSVLQPAAGRTVPALVEKLNTTHRSGFGEALATDGTHVVVGATESARPNEVTIYKRSGDTFAASTVLRPPAAVADDVHSFGRSLAVDGTLVAIGGILAGEGAVFLYRPDPFALGNWIPLKTLTDFNTEWGVKLDLSATVLAIGEGSGSSAGQIHLHRASEGGSNNWGLVQTLSAPPLGGGLFAAGDSFGTTFDLSGTRVVAARGQLQLLAGVGTTGGEPIFVFEANRGGVDQWGLEATIMPEDLGAASLGMSVALDGNRLVAAGLSAAGGRNKVWFLERTGSLWPEVGSFEVPAGVTPLPAQSFGVEVAISGDDAIVSYFDRIPEPNLRHVAAIFKRSGSGWNVVRAVSAGVLLDDVYGPEANGHYWAGNVAALAMRHGVLAFNALKPYASSTNRSGLVSVRVRDLGGTDDWDEAARLQPAPEWRPQFGAAMAAAGNYLVVGDPGDDEGETDSGAAFLFRRWVIRGSEEWRLVKKLKAQVPQAGERFGASVDLHVGDTTHVAIGAPGNSSGGAIYAYRFGAGVSEPEVVGPHALTGLSAGDEAGAAVAVSEHFVAVGSPGDGNGVSGNPGSVWIYQRIGASGLTSSGSLRATGRIDDGDRFGASLSMWGDYLAVGAPNDEGGGTVQIYKHQTGVAPTWTLVREINLGTASAVRFGAAVHLDGGYLAVGAPEMYSGRGQAYLYLQDSFTGSPSGWGLIQTVLAPLTSGSFGGSVATDGWNLLIGARTDSANFPGEGAAYLYRPRPGGLVWDREAQLFGNVPSNNYGFGEAVALSGSSLMVSSLKDDAGTVDHGAAYVYRAGSYEAWVGETNFDLKAPDAFAPLDDADGDDQTNLEEFGYGSDPCDSASRGQFEFTVRSDRWGPRIIAAEVKKPAYSTDGLRRRFLLSNGLRSFLPSSDEWVFDNGPERYAVSFGGRAIGDPPPAREQEFVALEFSYPQE